MGKMGVFVFKIFLDKEVLEYVEGLPVDIQFKCFFDLSSIQKFGLTMLHGGDVHFLSENQFKIEVFVKDQGQRIGTGMILHGHFKETNAGSISYYLTEAVAYLNTKVISTPWEKRRPGYIELDEQFFEEKKAHPFIQEGEENFCTGEYLLLRRMNKNRFHKSSKNVEACWNHHKNFGTHIPFSGSCEAWTGEYIYLKKRSLKPTINRFKRKYTEPYIIVNFIDELDPLNHHFDVLP